MFPRESRGSTIHRDVDERAVHDEPAYYEFTYSQPYEVSRNRRAFSRVEVKHLLIASCLLVLFSLSWLVSFIPPIFSDFSFTVFITLTAIFFLSFLPHELMHKAVAQRYGLLAEFRIIPSYAFLTLWAILLLPFFKIYAPGAVMIAGEASPETYGKTAAAGPAYNVTIGAVMFTLVFLFPDSAYFLVFGIFVNGWLALFNLFPIPPLDGEKVLHWSRAVFSILLAGAIALFAYGTIKLFA
jgi:Zn-dependent protease